MSKAFFIMFLELLKWPLLLAFQWIFSSGRMSKNVAIGLICLLLKGGMYESCVSGDPSLCCQRPQKALAKMISGRGRPMLPYIVLVQDHSILNDIFIFFEASEWAQDIRQRLAIRHLDFEKAYGWVD
eukprot:c28952_g1_i1 orf=2-382(+)